MTDPTPNNLPGPTPLSPAAQAVLDAAFSAYWSAKQEAPNDAHVIAAAALRAAADQVISKRIAFLSPGTVAGIRAELLAIATELRNHQ